MINRIRDWKIQIFQSLLLLLIIPAFLLFDIPSRITDILELASVDISKLEWYWQVLIGLGKWPLIIVTMYFTYNTIKKSNKERVLKQSLPKVIVWHSYFGYWFCHYILNYRTVSLIRVPIPVQFKLVWKDLFHSFECIEEIAKLDKGTDTVQINQVNDQPITSTINLVLADTYKLDWKSKLPADVLNLTTIIIDRVNKNGVRQYSPDFVDMVANAVHNLPTNVVSVNFFATINTAHVYHIAKDVFKTGGRDRIKHLYVYQQTSGSWVFEGKKIRIVSVKYTRVCTQP